MFTTATCPACRSAKEYFARKGVPYEERDVNGSPAGEHGLVEPPRRQDAKGEKGSRVSVRSFFLGALASWR